MESLRIADLTVKYRYGAVALSDVGFDAGKEVVCVFGETESGKTTLLKTVAGLVKQNAGTILFDGEDVTGKSAKDRGACLLYEDGGFFEYKTAYDNLVYPLKIRKVEEKERETVVRAAAEKVGFSSDKLSRKVKKLSKEDRVLLAFARACTHKSNIYLVDDAIKDTENREEVFFKIRPFVAEWAEEVPVLYATDSVEECESFGGKLLFLHYGIPEFFGTLDQIRRDPPDLVAVDRFLPDAKREEIVLNTEGEELVFDAFGKTFRLPKENLISDLFVGKTAVAVQAGDRVHLYDAKSERMIYFY